MRDYNTEAEMEYIPNVNWKRNHIFHMYNTASDDYSSDVDVYFLNQLELNPRLLAWLFDDNTLIGKTHLHLDAGRHQAFLDFCNSLEIWD